MALDVSVIVDVQCGEPVVNEIRSFKISNKYFNGNLRTKTNPFVMHRKFRQRTLTYFVSRSITVRLTSCLTSYDSAALLVLNYIVIYKYGRIQTSQTGGQTYSDTSPS